MIYGRTERLSIIGEAIVERYLNLSERESSFAETAEEIIDGVAMSCDYDPKESRLAILTRNFGADLNYLLGFSDGYRSVKAETLELALVSTVDNKLIGFRDGASVYRILSDRSSEKKIYDANA